MCKGSGEGLRWAKQRGATSLRCGGSGRREGDRAEIREGTEYDDTDLLFQFEMTDTTTTATARCGTAISNLDESTSSFLQLASAPEDAFSRQLKADVYRSRLVLEKVGTRASVFLEGLGRELSSQGYKVTIRKGLGLKQKEIFTPDSGFKPVTNTNPDCLEVLRHKFLVVEQVVTGIKGRAICSRVLVVQPDFKQHFHLPVTTNRYKNVLELLPDVFVGSRSHLKNLLEVVCYEMEQCFRANDRDVPPWRLLKSTLSKWCPKRYEECRIAVDAGYPDIDGHHKGVKVASKRGSIATGFYGPRHPAHMIRVEAALAA